jgi:beta-lactam-binding protein with PASTA domain
VPPPSGADEARLVPAVADLGFEDARKLLAARDLGAEAVDKDGASVPEEARATLAVKGQLPEAGEIVRAGETVRLTLG